MRIAVYCITKNEAAQIEGWCESAADADALVVADTGSTDLTVKIARTMVRTVVHEITVDPWRFDVARNASLALVPANIDYCICLDADERLQPGWRAALETITPDVTRPRYRYVWNWNADGTPGLTYTGDKIHTRRGYRWVHPVHEVCVPTAPEVGAFVAGLEIHHHADNSKPRPYLPLLELAVREDPHDPRNAHYLGREYFNTGQPARAAYELKRHLALPGATWAPERAKSMRLLARCEPALEETWLLRAAAEDPGRREVWLDMASMYYRTGSWEQCAAAAARCLSIVERGTEYLAEAEPWGAAPYDLAAIAAFRLGRLAQAVGFAEQACELAPGDKRLAANLKLCHDALV
jgi:tetratricopeptide (TPR) repeat protein